MSKLLAVIIGLVLLALAFVIFAPPETKEKANDIIAELDFLPAPLKEKAASILLSPAQRREKLIEELETNLEDLNNLLTKPVGDVAAQLPEAALALIQESKELLAKIQDINIDPGPVTAATEKIAAEIMEEIKKAVKNDTID